VYECLKTAKLYNRQTSKIRIKLKNANMIEQSANFKST